uniref:Guanine nucleotide-binding protein alpha subunit n=1 Tax=Oryza barthii TaxID=65489 RepID=A0A0D3G674_9ORYZ
MSVLTCVLDNMGSSCSRSHSLSEAETTKNAKTLTGEFCKRQKQSNTSTSSYFLIKLLFQTGFDEAELRSYTSVIHANVFQTIKILYEGAKELSQVESDSSKYVISPDNQEIGEKLSDIDGRLDYPLLNKELVLDVKRLWQDPAIQETYLRGSILQLPDCAQYFMENLDRLAEAGYVPTKEDVLYARVRTNGVVQIQFSPVGENKRGGEEARGMRGESGFIFLKVLMRYDQMLFEDETKNRMMETKELFDWVLKQRCFEKTSFILFLNKFDIFEKKIQKVPLSVCEWFKDYQPIAPGKQEVEHAYEFVKKKFEELYFQSSKPDRVDRVFKIYRTTALDQKLVKKTFKLIDESMRRSREGT